MNLVANQTPAECDAIVIGAGPNGLTAAAVLATRGWRVLVLEAAESLGGGTRTQALTLPGFLHDVCSAVHPTALASPAFAELGLVQEGVEFLHPPLPLVHPLDHGEAAVLHRDLEQTIASLGPDGWRYRALFESLIADASKLYPAILNPLQLPAQPLAMINFGLRAFLPSTLLADMAFKTPAARALLAGNAAHSVQPLESPFTAAIALMLQFTAHALGWPVVRGGSQRIAEALERILRRHGGEIHTNSPVSSLRTLPQSRVVLFDTSPSAMADIAAEDLPTRYRNRLRRFQHGAGIFKVDYALSEPVPWTNPDCRKAGTLHVGGTLEEIAQAERAACDGIHPERPFVLVSQPSVADPGRAPAGRQVLWAYCHVPAHSSRDMRPAIEAQIERFAPGFRDTILAAHSMNCRQMQLHNGNYLGGDIAGGQNSWAQLLTRPVVSLNPYATPNPRLFLCSASTPPAGGVHGMCGANAAQAVLKRYPQVGKSG
jgi:phytoene dehydrogenase-like protein